MNSPLIKILRGVNQFPLSGLNSLAWIFSSSPEISFLPKAAGDNISGLTCEMIELGVMCVSAKRPECKTCRQPGCGNENSELVGTGDEWVWRPEE